MDRSQPIRALDVEDDMPVMDEPEQHSTRHSSAHGSKTTIEGKGDGGTGDEPEPEVMPGSKSEIKYLFGVHKTSSDRWDWEDRLPEQIGEAQATQGLVPGKAREAFALVHRRIVYRGDEEPQTYRIDVNGLKLCGFLSKVLQDCPEEHVGRLKSELDPPCVALFHRRKKYQEILDQDEDLDTKIQARLLMTLLDQIWIRHSSAYNEAGRTGLIEPESCWTIFPPNELVIVRIEGAVSLAKLTRSEPGYFPHELLTLRVKVVNWNGSYCGYEDRSHSIAEFSGLKRISELEVYPLRFHDDPRGLEEMLLARGRAFEALRGYHFKAYHTRSPSQKESSRPPRIVIDTYTYYRHGTYLTAPEYTRLEGSKTAQTSVGGRLEPLEDNSQGAEERQEDLRPLSDDDCRLAVPYVMGFDLESKTWTKFDFNGFREIQWDENAFDQLVLDNSRKRLLLAFTKRDDKEEGRFDDLVSGKGNGMVILLCGPLGVGKTLTAESVAERTRCPLYRLGANDLGTDPSMVEERLKLALDLCAAWKAILLIDEADVVMGHREVNSLTRNELVSIFLRLLEYYRGILFLTTNRTSSFDTAFESRIDLVIPYTNLDKAARYHVWEHFFEKLGSEAHSISDRDLDELAEWEMNGHEIKSVIKSGLILATTEGNVLTLDSLRVILTMRQQTAVALGRERLSY